jgi:DNA-binding CsgD family transcriptional regulator
VAAQVLHVSENTVKFHIKSIRRKLGLSGQAASLRQFLFQLGEGG